MKNTFARLPLFSVILLMAMAWASCDKTENTPKNTGTVKLRFKATHNGEPFVINQIYRDFLNHRIRVEQFKSYFNNIYLVKEDDTQVMLKDVILVNFGSGAEVVTSVPVGKYKALHVGMGVPKEQNKDQDPTQYPETHPLSSTGSQGMFWHWNTGYIFTKYEGKTDLDGVDGNPLADSFAFHIGDDALHREKTFEADIKVHGDNVLVLTLEIDCFKLFSSDFDSIDIADESLTHTSGNLVLAERFTELLSAALTLK